MGADAPKLSHIDEGGRARMVDVSTKAISARLAVAEGSVTMSAEALGLIRSGNIKKGDVLTTARLAGILAAKRTSELIPLCHLLPLDDIEVEIAPDETLPGLRVTSTVRMEGKTGVEMEALVAVSVACLTIYDMAKMADRGMVIGGVRLLEKSGGRSGHWRVQR